MTQRRRTSKAKAKRRFGRRAFLTGAGAAACAAAGGGTCGRKAMQTTLPPPGRIHPRHPTLPCPPGEWRAVWVSYLDWALLDFSTEDTFRAGARSCWTIAPGWG